MFTNNHFGSQQQLVEFLSTAGKLGVKDRIYIDTANTRLYKALSYIIESDYKRVGNLIVDIETNFIIGLVETDLINHTDKFVRIKFDPTSETKLKTEDVDLTQLLK